MIETKDRSDVAETAVEKLRWIRLARYCELSGDTADAVRTRRRKRQWKDGVECKLGPDGNLWVCPSAVNAWVLSGAERAAAF